MLSAADERRIPLRVRSLVGLLPLCATTTLGSVTLQRLPDFAARVRWSSRTCRSTPTWWGRTHVRDGFEAQLLSMVEREQLRRILEPMLSEQEFLSPHEPAESTSGLFGGNSNWRGPVWFPVHDPAEQ